jgi:hypothetical protein
MGSPGQTVPELGSKSALLRSIFTKQTAKSQPSQQQQCRKRERELKSP